MNTAPTGPPTGAIGSVGPQAGSHDPVSRRRGPAAARRRRSAGRRAPTRRGREPWPGEWRTGRVAHAGSTAVNSIVDLLAAGAHTEDVAAAIDRAALAARELVGWPTGEAMTRLLSTARGCARHRAGGHTVQTCADLADALRSVQEALRFDGFLPAITHPEPADAALTRFLASLAVAVGSVGALRGGLDDLLEGGRW